MCSICRWVRVLSRGGRKCLPGGRHSRLRHATAAFAHLRRTDKHTNTDENTFIHTNKPTITFFQRHQIYSVAAIITYCCQT